MWRRPILSGTSPRDVQARHLIQYLTFLIQIRLAALARKRGKWAASKSSLLGAHRILHGSSATVHWSRSVRRSARDFERFFTHYSDLNLPIYREDLRDHVLQADHWGNLPFLGPEALAGEDMGLVHHRLSSVWVEALAGWAWACLYHHH